jgi:hypothetical protein
VHIGEHLRRKGATIHIVQLPQLEGQNKTGIDDYLLRYSIEDAERLVGEFKLEQPEDKNRFVSGFVLPDGTVGEMVVSSDDERSFMIVANGSVRKAYHYETPRVTYLLPTISWWEKLCILPQLPFLMTRRQFFSKKSGISFYRYLELPADFEEITSLYVLLTWVFEFAPSIPYLRVIGDWARARQDSCRYRRHLFPAHLRIRSDDTSAHFPDTGAFPGNDGAGRGRFQGLGGLVGNGQASQQRLPPGHAGAARRQGEWQVVSAELPVFGPKLISTRFNFKDEALRAAA